MQFDLTQIALALAEYRQQRGVYPQTLDELQPEFLAEIPLDRFTGNPLIYAPRDDGYLLYSFGRDGEDDGGQYSPGNLDINDIVIRIPSAAP